jgi:hypothetical protein
LLVFFAFQWVKNKTKQKPKAGKQGSTSQCALDYRRSLFLPPPIPLNHHRTAPLGLSWEAWFGRKWAVGKRTSSPILT